MTEEPTLGERIAAGRKALGLTQRALADRLSVHELAVSRWETGRANPSHEHRLAVAELLGIDPRDLGVLLQRADAQTDPPAWAVAHHDDLIAVLDTLRERLDRLEKGCCEERGGTSPLRSVE